MTTTSSPYIGPTQKIKRIWHPERELFNLSEKILEWFYNDELGIVIIHGQQGYGKSTYGGISCSEVYGHQIEGENKNQFYYNWEAVKRHIVWTPKQFIDLSNKKPPRKDENYKIHPNTLKKEPMILWDDAGYWLNAMDFHHPLCVQVSKYLEVARSRWGAIVFTVSDQRQILNKIRGIPHAWSVPIRKAGTPKRGNPNYKWVHDRRFAQLHKSWCSEDLKKSGKKGEKGDIFYARLPGRYDPLYPESTDDEDNIVYIDNITREYTLYNKDIKGRSNKRATYGFYGWYKPFRDSFCDLAGSTMEQIAKETGQYS